MIFYDIRVKTFDVVGMRRTQQQNGEFVCRYIHIVIDTIRANSWLSGSSCSAGTRANRFLAAPKQDIDEPDWRVASRISRQISRILVEPDALSSIPLHRWKSRWASTRDMMRITNGESRQIVILLICDLCHDDDSGECRCRSPH